MLMLCCTGDVSAQVQVREDTLLIPTYLVDPPNPMPRFYEGRTHQGVQRRVYPYLMNDGLTRVKEDRPYHIAYFENEYINLGIMPRMGGRIFFAEDKKRLRYRSGNVGVRFRRPALVRKLEQTLV